MASVYNFSEPEILAFFLVLVRMSAFVVSWPVFGSLTVPPPVKILFSLALALCIFPVISWTQVSAEVATTQLFWLGIREAFIGLTLGFLSRLFFFALHIAGQIVSVSMGISSGQLFNPALGTNSNSVEQFHVVVATLFFLAINGHHLLLGGLVDSFNLVPLGTQLLSLGSFEGMGRIVQEITVIGIKLCTPVMIAILFMNLAMAVIGRAVPQINVLITSLPVNILVGFLVIMVALPLMVWQMHDLLDLTTTRLFQVMKSF